MFLFAAIIKRLLLCFAIAVLACCSSQSSQQKLQYYTWDGLEPDRWASVWLLKRHVAPDANIAIVPVGARLRGSIAIATPDAEIRRTHGKSNFENLLAAYNQSNNKGLMRIGEVINELEISPWSRSTPLVKVVEREFRSLQNKYNRVDVPGECYAGFFDALYTALSNGADGDLAALSSALGAAAVCQASVRAIATNIDGQVLEYPVNHVLNLINADRKVTFVDTREAGEFEERHIPGAVNLKLREVSSATAAQFSDADLVIAYCIKDFRGYEVALALSRAGVKNVGILNPFGLKGWVDTGLPVVDKHIDEAGGIEMLRHIANTGV